MKNPLYINRIRQGMTQQMLAERAGISRRTLCDLEQDKRLPSYRVALRLCRVLGLRPEEVFFP